MGRFSALLLVASLAACSGGSSTSPTAPEPSSTVPNPSPIYPVTQPSIAAAATRGTDATAVAPSAINPLAEFTPLPVPGWVPPPVTSLSDSRIHLLAPATYAQALVGAAAPPTPLVPPDRPLYPTAISSKENFSTSLRTRDNTIPSAGGQQHAALGELWYESGLLGYEDEIPFPFENAGYKYTPSTNDTIFISSSPDGDPVT